ncbi:glycosyltransferase, partial [Candidatus Poribacteria bacterium]|nr:glycosyltransferase [Candidatus Poribacteria bacterium]
MKKRIALLNFFPAFSPPRSGGELRVWHLASRLGKMFDVRMAAPTYPDHKRETIEHGEGFSETRFPKTSRYITWHHALGRFADFQECSALVTLLSAPSHGSLKREVVRLTRGADVVIHSFPYLYPLYPKAKGRQLLVYDAHNVEARLAREMFGSGLWADWAVRRIARAEGKLAGEAHLVLATNPDDADSLCALYGIDHSKILIVPNGVDVASLRPPADETARAAARERLKLAADRPALLFIGSFHPPNVEAAEFLTGTVAPRLGGADFLLAGKVCEAFKDRPLPSNVRALGLVDEQTKSDLFAGCHAALNPMFSGSGTNLKMLDFFAAGLPVVTTPVGARGLGITDGEHAVIAERDVFALAVDKLLASAETGAALARNARQLAEGRFSWDSIADELHQVLDHRSSRRIIMLNDYPVTPVDQGGRVRLNALARSLSASVAPVTFLTLTGEAQGRRVQHTERFEEVNIPRPASLRRMDKALSGLLGVGADDASVLAFHRRVPAMKRMLAGLAPWAETVVFSHCYMEPFGRRLRQTVPCVYDSHNAEFYLKRKLYKKSLAGGWLQWLVRRAERRLLRECYLTSTVSKRDVSMFTREFKTSAKRMIVAENGVDCSNFTPIPVSERAARRKEIGMGPEPTAVFVGSAHPPNAEAAKFIIEKIAPANPGVHFLIVGSVNGWFEHTVLPENVTMMGVLDEKVKRFVLETSDIGLNPMFEGSGSSLKVPEYLSAGLAVVSTA